MHFPSIPIVAFASVFVAFLVQFSSAHELAPRASPSGILINPPGFPPLPTSQDAKRAAGAENLNLTNVQGDILIGMRKNKELFFFFGINPNSVATFKSKLASSIYPLITTTTQLLDVATQPVTAVNIAFSQRGLTALGINGTDPLNDSVFAAGQAVDADSLGDPTPISANWVPGFADTASLHGVFLLASDTVENVNAELANIKSILGNSIVEIHRIQGEARLNNQSGHEHFGFLDGISQPAVQGFIDVPTPGQAVVPAGVILLGETNDTVPRPDWAKDGSFLAFRQLQQFVPEFNKFLTDNPIRISPLTVEQGSALMGARMFGRWKSGAPVDLAPRFDDPVLAADPNRNNDFNFLLAGDQSRCPFSAHIRKTNPRADFEPDHNINSFPANHIIRASIPYGPDVNSTEAASNTTTIARGLAFGAFFRDTLFKGFPDNQTHLVGYQSNIANGFQFQQQTWANNPFFLNHARDPGNPGFDPIIGANHSNPRDVTGLDATNEKRTITLPKDFIVSRGGEYFFSPSLSAIIGTLAV